MKRRDFLQWSSLAALSGLAGCASPGLPPAAGFPPARFRLRVQEQALLATASPTFDLVIRGAPNSALLRRRARPVPPELKLDAAERRMVATINKAGGVGLAGPQVGLGLRVAVVVVGARGKTPRTVFARNPIIVSRSDRTADGYEGCLSIPKVGGLVRRSQRVTVQHTLRGGEVVTEQASGFDAVVWQHELDHLDGVLYTDRLLGELLPMEEVRRRRKAAEQAGASAALWPPRSTTVYL